jgi:DNA-binding transcriptional MerR regulator
MGIEMRSHLKVSAIRYYEQIGLLEASQLSEPESAINA